MQLSILLRSFVSRKNSVISETPAPPWAATQHRVRFSETESIHETVQTPWSRGQKRNFEPFGTFSSHPRNASIPLAPQILWQHVISPHSWWEKVMEIVFEATDCQGQRFRRWERLGENLNYNIPMLRLYNKSRAIKMSAFSLHSHPRRQGQTVRAEQHMSAG